MLHSDISPVGKLPLRLMCLHLLLHSSLAKLWNAKAYKWSCLQNNLKPAVIQNGKHREQGLVKMQNQQRVSGGRACCL